MEVAVPGIDLGKNVCSLPGFDGGKVTLRRRMKRDRLPALAERLPPCVVAKAQKNGDHLALGRDRQKTIASSGPRDYSCRASSIALIR
jgi:hypothetical protein